MSAIKRACSIGFRVIGISAALVALWINIEWFNEAFGDGPPYYGRSTNMDKWQNPLPVLLAIDGLTLLIIAVSLLIYRRKRKP